MGWPISSFGARKGDSHNRRDSGEGVQRTSAQSAEAYADGPVRKSRPPRTSVNEGNPGVNDVAARSHESGLVITDVQVRLVDNDRLRAWATITFNGVFVVKGIRVIQGNTRLFVAMPSKQQKDGKYQDIAHPINPDFRDFLERRILDVYHRIDSEGGYRVAPRPFPPDTDTEDGEDF
jgi:stage V sporulation protein G